MNKLLKENLVKNQMLEEFKEEIESLDPMGQVLTYNIDSWITAIEKYAEDLESIHEFFQGQISRKSLFEYCNDDVSIQRKFFAIMLWGFGSGDDLRPAGYGPYRVNKFIEDGVLDNLEAAIIKLNDGNVIESLKSLLATNNLGVSFASKLLYFLSLNMQERAFILDLRVARSLHFLLKNFNPSYIYQNPVNAYRVYLLQLKMWHKRYAHKKEQLEYFLFQKNGFNVDFDVSIGEISNTKDCPNVVITSASRYAKLSAYFSGINEKTVKLTSDDMADILGSTLPPWAFNPQYAFWSNAYYNDHKHRYAWLNHGYQVTQKEIDQENQLAIITFQKVA
ncbi:MAG: hypothetical protein RIA69_14990 [Cyclobacteriaceae bacterium]